MLLYSAINNPSDVLHLMYSGDSWCRESTSQVCPKYVRIGNIHNSSFIAPRICPPHTHTPCSCKLPRALHFSDLVPRVSTKGATKKTWQHAQSLTFLSVCNSKKRSTEWVLFGALQLTWLVQHNALINDTLSWKWMGAGEMRRETFSLIEIHSFYKAWTMWYPIRD